MKKLKKLLVLSGFALMLIGCAAQKSSDVEITFLEETTVTESHIETMVQEVRWSAEDIQKEIRYLETNFGYGLEFNDMEKDVAISYGEAIGEYYDFVGRDEKTYEETIIYSLDQIDNIYVGADKEVLYIQPNDMVEPGEIMEAFVLKYLGKEEGREYLADVLERGVRLTAPDSRAVWEIFSDLRQYTEWE